MHSHILKLLYKYRLAYLFPTFSSTLFHCFVEFQSCFVLSFEKSIQEHCFERVKCVKNFLAWLHQDLHLWFCILSCTFCNLKDLSIACYFCFCLFYQSVQNASLINHVCLIEQTYNTISYLSYLDMSLTVVVAKLYANTWPWYVNNTIRGLWFNDVGVHV